MMKKIKNNIPLYNKTHNVRRGQSIAPFGVGAIVDFIDQTLMTAAPEYWKECITIHDERLENALGVNEFKTPPSVDEYKLGLPFVRFPEWYFCPSCRRLKPIDQWEIEYKKNYKPRKNSISNDMKAPKCLECKSKPYLVPARIITVCTHGHIQDFPWIEWTHINDDKPLCINPQLKISTGANTAGLEGIKLECTCGAKTTMAKSFHDNIFMKLDAKLKTKGWYDGAKNNFRCKGNKPWKGVVEECTDYPKTLQRGASNVYFSKVESSIVIPPYSDKLNIDIENSRIFENLNNHYLRAVSKGNRENFIEEYLQDYITDIAKDLNGDKNIIKKVIYRKLGLLNDGEKQLENRESITRNKYREEEYKALIGELQIEESISKDFKIQEKSGGEYNIPQIKRVVLVHKMREVRALTGFSRINPPDQNIISGDAEEYNKVGCIVSVKEEKTNWYPAHEVRGEGVFIEFDEERINKWVDINDLIKQRANKIDSRNKDLISQRGFSDRDITPKFILMHTIAHLLIRQLSFECGYSSASLRERIFCNENDEEYKMSGILIYTASGDAEGTLGGLVRQGLPDALPKVIKNAVQKASWCSGDPVCIESEGQGRGSLNLAACHACTLVSETSCEEFNLLLDRAMVVGTLDNPEIGFFEDLLL